MIDDTRRPESPDWRAELLQSIGPRPTLEQAVLVEVVVGSRDHLRVLGLLARAHVVHDRDRRCRLCCAYPRRVGDRCPGSPMLAALTARSVVRLVRALRMLGLTRHDIREARRRAMH